MDREPRRDAATYRSLELDSDSDRDRNFQPCLWDLLDISFTRLHREYMANETTKRVKKDKDEIKASFPITSIYVWFFATSQDTMTSVGLVSNHAM